MCCAMQDLTFSVKSNIEKGKTVHLLKNVTGFFEPNKMSALVSHMTNIKSLKTVMWQLPDAWHSSVQYMLASYTQQLCGAIAG